MSSLAVELRSADAGQATELSVRAQPGARRSGLAGVWNKSLKLAVAAPPEDGRANAALQRLLAELFGLRPSAVELVRGHSSRSKVFKLALPPRETRARLDQLLAS